MAEGQKAAAVVAVLSWEWPEPAVELDGPFDLGNSVALAPLPEWLRDTSVIEDLSLHDREMLTRMAVLALVVDPSAALTSQSVRNSNATGDGCFVPTKRPNIFGPIKTIGRSGCPQRISPTLAL